MSSIDGDSLLRPLSEDDPCGLDLEYDPDMAALEEAARGKPEQQYGSTIIQAEPPDWSAARKSALALLERTRDIRVVVTLANASLGLGKLEDFAECLRVLDGYVKNFWSSVHPRLDEDDDNDPTSRVNALAALCDHSTTLRLAQRVALVSAQGLGSFSLLDAHVASGEAMAPPDMEEEPSSSTIDAAFLNADLESLVASEKQLEQILDYLQSIEITVTQQVGAGSAMSLDKLREIVVAMKALLRRYLGQRSSEVATEEEPEGSLADSSDSSQAAPRPKANPAEINSREDVIRAIDRICDYYARVEPSSPLPLLLKRAKRLATKSFLDIIRDLTPEALGQATALAGSDPED